VIRAVLLGAGGQLGTDVAIAKPPTVQLVSLTRKELDIRERKPILKLLRDQKPHVVINTAGYVNVDGAEDELSEAFHSNAVGARHVAEGCAETGASLLHVSTDFVFDGTLAESDGFYDEDSSPSPINAYGISKYAGEQFIRSLTDRHYILRTASLYGKVGSHGKSGNFVYSILNKARSGEKIRAVADITMSPTSTADLSLYIWTIIWKVFDYGTYHAVNSGACSWYDFARAVVKYAGLEADITPISHKDYPFRARRPLRTPLATKKELKMRSWESALEEFVESLP